MTRFAHAPTLYVPVCT